MSKKLRGRFGPITTKKTVVSESDSESEASSSSDESSASSEAEAPSMVSQNAAQMMEQQQPEEEELPMDGPPELGGISIAMAPQLGPNGSIWEIPDDYYDDGLEIMSAEPTKRRRSKVPANADPSSITLRDLMRDPSYGVPMLSSVLKKQQQRQVLRDKNKAKKAATAAAGAAGATTSSSSSSSNMNNNTNNEEEDDDEPEERRRSTLNLAAPQVQVGEDGTIVLQKDSLTVTAQSRGLRANEMRDVEETDKVHSSRAYTKSNLVDKWTEEETTLFYDGLSKFGCDFEMLTHHIKTECPKRNRTQVKRKFKAEEKRDLEKVNRAISRSLKQKFVWPSGVPEPEKAKQVAEGRDIEEILQEERQKQRAEEENEEGEREDTAVSSSSNARAGRTVSYQDDEDD